MNLEKLRVFCTAHRLGSFSAAADTLGITQPSVSAHIRDLERAVALPLFDRVGRGIAPTDAGDALAGYAERILRLESDAEEAMGSLRGLTAGRLHIGASTTPGTYLLPPILARFRRAHPGVRTSMEIGTSGAIATEVRTGRLELGVVGSADERTELTVEPWRHDELVLVAAKDHRWNDRPPRRSAELDDEAFVGREEGSSIKAATEAWLEAHGRSPDVVMELSGTYTVLQAVAAGLGVTITTRAALPHPGVAEVRFPRLPIRRTLALVRREGRTLLPAAEAMRALILPASDL